MFVARANSFLRVALLLAPLSLGLAACETLQDLNPLGDEKKTPLTGDRRAVFPNGVPGVQYSAPPTQPSNSNVPLDMQNPPPQQQTPDAAPEQQPQQQPPARQARTKRAPSSPAANTQEDPWAERR